MIYQGILAYFPLPLSRLQALERTAVVYLSTGQSFIEFACKERSHSSKMADVVLFCCYEISA